MPDPPTRKWYQDMTIGRAALLILFTPIALGGAFIGLVVFLTACGAYWYIPEFITHISPLIGLLVMAAIAWYAVWKVREWAEEKYPRVSEMSERYVGVNLISAIVGGVAIAVLIYKAWLLESK